MFLERFYTYEQKNILDNATQKIPDTPLENIEEQFSVVIISTKSNEELDNINGDLIWQFGQKKIKLNKFWITQETLDALTNGSIYKVYDQGYSRFKVLTKFLIYENDVYAIAKPMPAMTETINIVNKFIVILMGIAAILITCLLWVLTKKVITNPLDILKDLSQDIANLKFRKVEINTNDEMAQLAKSINKMSEDIEKAYNESNEKNIRLKDLLSNVSHELKTAVVKHYCNTLA